MTKSENSATIINPPSLTLLAISLFSHSLHTRSLKIDTVEEYSEFLSFFGGTNRRSLLSKAFYTWQKAPDICASCFTIFGLTIGGRVRVGCPLCRSCSIETRNAVIFFQVFSGLSSSEEATFWLSRILTKYYSTTDLSGA